MEIKLKTVGKGAGLVEVTLGELTIWFSYAEPIAYHHYRTGYVMRENDWGSTTGRHLNSIHPHKASDRIPGDEFMDQLGAILGSMTKPERAT